MRVLVACEESQEVCKAFRARGHEAYSCDIQPCSGGHPEWHIQDDVLKHLEGWDLIIAHPPCTDLAVAGAPSFREKQKDGRQQKAIVFFMQLALAPCERVAVENPVCIMSSAWRKPDQIIHPYQFGNPARKKTCLWLRGLPPLSPTAVVEPEIIHYKNGRGTDTPWHMNTLRLPAEERRRLRSKTFPGIAKAMAEQWG